MSPAAFAADSVWPGFEVIQLPWRWEWVPGPDNRHRSAWAEQVASLFTGWTADGLAALREAWSVESAEPFPVGDDAIGAYVGTWLRDRADQLPAWSRLAWGAAYLGATPRWAPVPVVVEFREPAEPDPGYLMTVVGASGLIGDGREPEIDYVTTNAGDGVRVTALVRGGRGEVGGRVDAAMRIDIPAGLADRIEETSVDVVLSTRVFDLGLLAAIGPGVEQLMRLVADECAPAPGSGPPGLVFTSASGSSP